MKTKATLTTAALVALVTQQAAANSCAATTWRGLSSSGFLPSQRVQQQRQIHLHSPFEHATRMFTELASAAVASASPAVAQPTYDVTQTPTGYTLSLELPGCGLKDVQIEVEEGGEILKIEGRRPAIGARQSTTLRSRFELKDIDTERIKATLSNGVLTVQLHKTAKPRAVQIPISFAEEATADAATDAQAAALAPPQEQSQVMHEYCDDAAADAQQSEQQQQQQQQDEEDELTIADDYEQQEHFQVEPSPTAFEDTPSWIS